jgi:hypothetical protein
MQEQLPDMLYGSVGAHGQHCKWYLSELAFAAPLNFPQPTTSKKRKVQKQNSIYIFSFQTPFLVCV